MGKDEKKLVESVLFSAGHPVSRKEIKEATGLSSPTLSRILKQLMQEYETERDSALEIVKAGEKFVMQVKAPFTESSESVSDPELDAALLKTLSLIAFHQPIKQSNLRRLAGEKIYDHVDKLHEMKLIHTKKHRQTEMITLTKLFPEYFGLDVTKPDDIRTFLMGKLTENVVRNRDTPSIEG